MALKLKDCLNFVTQKALEYLGDSDADTMRVTVQDDAVTAMVPTAEGVWAIQLATDTETNQPSEVLIQKEHFVELPGLEKQYVKLYRESLEPGEMPEGLPSVVEVHGS